MKQILKFLDNGQFQSFTSQLFCADSPTYEPVEGAGGDRGIDGIDGDTVYQMYFPEEKNRKDAKYKKKIDDDLSTLQDTIKEEELVVKRWILVVPEDLSANVVIHLKNKTKEVGFDCIHYGANRLNSLVHKYPHIKNAYPQIFLPDVNENLGAVKNEVRNISQKKFTEGGVEVLTDIEFARQKKDIEAETEKEKEFIYARIGPSSALELALNKVDAIRTEKLEPLMAKKKASDRYYEMELEELAETYQTKIDAAYSEYYTRGMSQSGMEVKAIFDIKKARNREEERLALKYGKPFDKDTEESTED